MRPRKRILAFAGGSLVFGAEIAFLACIRELARRGHDVHCVCNGWNDGDFPGRLAAAGISHESMKLGWIYPKRPRWTADTLVHYPGALAACLRVLRKFEPDCVYHQNYRSAISTPFLYAGYPTVVHAHETLPTNVRSKAAYRWLRNRVSTFVATSEFIKRDLVEKGVPAGKIRVAYPPVAVAGASDSAPRSQHGVPRIGIVGQVIPRKGHADLLEALARVHGEGLAFTLEVYGRGPQDWLEQLKSTSVRLGIADRIHWHGYLADQSQIYRDLDLVVVPTRDAEAFGLVAAEPALWQLPVVASASGGLPEIVVDGETGFLCRPGDVSDLAAKISQLLRAPEARARMGAAARSRVTNLFTVERAADVIEAALGV